MLAEALAIANGKCTPENSGNQFGKPKPDEAQQDVKAYMILRGDFERRSTSAAANAVCKGLLGNQALDFVKGLDSIQIGLQFVIVVWVRCTQPSASMPGRIHAPQLVCPDGLRVTPLHGAIRHKPEQRNRRCYHEGQSPYITSDQGSAWRFPHAMVFDLQLCLLHSHWGHVKSHASST
eukprot:3980425-Amphidinium_carterae.1